MFAECTETVSILYAIIFGAGDACVLISTWSLLTALGAFLVLVIIAQIIARRLWARLRAPKPPPRERQTGAIVDDPKYTDSAIRSSRR